MIFSDNVAGVDKRDRSSFSDLAKQFVAAHYPKQGNTQAYAHTHTLCLAASGTYKTLGGIIHEAQLEALLVLKGLCQGVTQVVGGQGSFATVLELGKNTLKRKREPGLRLHTGSPHSWQQDDSGTSRV